MGAGFRLWFAIHAHYLLPRRVRHAGKNAGFGHGGEGLVLQYSADRDMFLSEGLNEKLSELVITYHANRKNVYTQIREIVNRVRATSRRHAAIAMFQNQHRRFPGNPRDFAIHEFVGHKIAEYGHGSFRKSFDDLFQPTGFLRLIHCSLFYAKSGETDFLTFS